MTRSSSFICVLNINFIFLKVLYVFRCFCVKQCKGYNRNNILMFLDVFFFFFFFFLFSFFDWATKGAKKKRVGCEREIKKEREDQIFEEKKKSKEKRKGTKKAKKTKEKQK